ncbi:SOS response-associated peptidase [Cellulomonas fimi]|uniref:SOS response-associated peptidase n=1 Tax=Cellulomonas fimi TaxID=1708 RepID=UPI00234CCD14|nr:SOS response-associated peptidase [Cellulomonas fimi]MDC7120587.1 SOS response-associated peptidase [Cellulomonas fimi]
MCGRYAQTRAADEIARDLDVEQMLVEAGGPSWNVAPTNVVPVVLERVEDDEIVRQLRAVRWGLVPSWAKDPAIGSRLINARAETITDKPSFRRAALARRAVVPMDGYYEWGAPLAGSKRKTPYYLHSPDEAPLAAAGLYELWPDPAKDKDDPERWMWTFTVITTTATDSTGHIHDRSPLLLPADLVDAWLNPTVTELDAVRDLLAAVPEPHLVPRQVGYDVGNVRNDGPHLVDPVA